MMPKPIAKIKNIELYDRPDGPELTICYPRNDDHIQQVRIDLEDVRAADGIRVSYDFERDGWKIEQAQFFEWASEDTVCDPGYIEVAFIQAWGSEKGGDE